MRLSLKSPTMLTSNGGPATPGTWTNTRSNVFGSPSGGAAAGLPGQWGGPGLAQAAPEPMLMSLSLLSQSPPRFGDSQQFFGAQDFERASPNRLMGPHEDAPPQMSIFDAGVGTPERARNFAVSSGSVGGRALQGAQAATPAGFQRHAPGTRSPLGNAPFTGASYPSTAMSENRSTVMIFGFPPSASATVLAAFRDHGEILHHSVDTEGNWMYIKYATRFSAQKALSRNGTVMQGGFGQGKWMVGVLEAPPEKDDELSALFEASSPMRTAQNPLLLEDSMPGTGNWDVPVNRPALGTSSGLQPVGRLFTPSSGGTISTTMRTLPQSAILQAEQPTPSSGSAGVLNKVGDWLLGWS